MPNPIIWRTMHHNRERGTQEVGANRTPSGRPQVISSTEPVS